MKLLAVLYQGKAKQQHIVLKWKWKWKWNKCCFDSKPPLRLMKRGKHTHQIKSVVNHLISDMSLGEEGSGDPSGYTQVGSQARP